MGEFFRGWRRKAGCVALVMAVALTAYLMRSHIVYDEFGFDLRGRTHSFSAVGGKIFWRSGPTNPEDNHSVSWTAESAQSIDLDYVELHLRAVQESDGWMGCGTDLWRIILPLTLLSACLILWKPRKRREVPDA